jgi:hypothetical protein
VRFVTARELPLLYASQTPGPADRASVARHLAEHETFLETDHGALSAAEMLQILLGMEPAFAEGPSSRAASTYHLENVSRPAFERATADASGFIRVNHRLPAEIWIGSEKLSLADFAATLAADTGETGAVTVRKGNLEMEKYVSTDARGSFLWPIHPEGFSAPELLELARLQAWTLKPARLK